MTQLVPASSTSSRNLIHADQGQRPQFRLHDRRPARRAVDRLLQLARHHRRDVGRAGGGAEIQVPRAALRSARARRHRGAGGPLCLRHAGRRRGRAPRRAVDRARPFRRPVDGRRDRARARRAASRPRRPRDRLRLALHVDPGVEPAVGGADRDGAEEGHGGPGRADHRALVPARDGGEEPAASRQGAGR